MSEARIFEQNYRLYGPYQPIWHYYETPPELRARLKKGRRASDGWPRSRCGRPGAGVLDLSDDELRARGGLGALVIEIRGELERIWRAPDGDDTPRAPDGVPCLCHHAGAVHVLRIDPSDPELAAFECQHSDEDGLCMCLSYAPDREPRPVTTGEKSA